MTNLDDELKIVRLNKLRPLEHEVNQKERLTQMREYSRANKKKLSDSDKDIDRMYKRIYASAMYKKWKNLKHPRQPDFKISTTK